MPVFLAAPEIYEWLHNTILNPDHEWYNNDHSHLMDYRVSEISFLWAQNAYIKKNKVILGECEKVMMMAGGWKRERQEMWFKDTLGDVPTYLITLDANYCRDCTDAEFAALVEHELYHISHKADEFGDPAFTQDGKPQLEIVSHDVEEFFGVVRRYGGDEAVRRMAELQDCDPQIKY
jgi:hypothetical protein